MLSRRGMIGCWICAVTTGFSATEVSAQGAPPATAGLSRKVLSQIDGPTPGYVTIIAEVTIPPGAVVGRHSHPGIETGYVVEGEVELPIGDKVIMLKPGDAFQVPVGVAHGGGKASAMQARAISTFVVEKDKPLASPA